MKKFITKWNSISLVLRIIIGLTVGFLLAIVQIQLSDPIKCVDSDYTYVEMAETNVCIDEVAYKKATEAEIKATEGAIKAEAANAVEDESASKQFVDDIDQDLVLEYVEASEETTTDAYTTSGKIASAMKIISILGTLFVGALKAVAPLLVFFLVMEAITKHKAGQKTNMKNIIALYLLGTFLAAVVAVFMSFVSPVELTLAEAPQGFDAPKGLVGILQDLLLRVVANPIESIATANYIGVLFWAVVIALAIKTVVNNENTINVVSTIAQGLGQVVKWVISFAPFGIMGLIFDAISTTGIKAMASYGHLILILIGSMFIVALVVNPIIAFIMMRKNPYPLVFKCLKDSGITAFFTRSSAANIPVNMELCEELGLEEDTYAISIPLGATINMAGAAITITVLTLAAANTYGIPVTIPQALFLSFLAALSACGASGVAGGSLLLIPLACSLFNIPQDYAMQVVGVGFIVGVIQDSCETALNSSTDVLFTAIADFANKRKR